MLAVTTGHIDLGETPIEACLREVSEEVGIKLENVNLSMLGTAKRIRITKDRIEKLWNNRTNIFIKFR